MAPAEGSVRHDVQSSRCLERGSAARSRSRSRGGFATRHATGWLSCRQNSSTASKLGGSSEAKPVSEKLPLNAAQHAVVDMVVAGHNIFLTGAAGTGKSRVLAAIQQRVRRGGRGRLALTASTGTAAVLLGGQTLHSWAGIGRGSGDVDSLVRDVLQNTMACQRWQETSLLVIDEISMISGHLFDALDAVGRVVRRCPERPFGGLQLLLCGDFRQLPPMQLDSEGWAFEARSWDDAVGVAVELTEPLRADPQELTFVRALDEVRAGTVSDESWSLLEWLARRPREEARMPTQLVPTNAMADEINTNMLRRVASSCLGDVLKFRAEGLGRSGGALGGRSSTGTIPAILELCAGAMLILTQTIVVDGRKLPNGTRCRVTGFIRLPNRVFDPRTTGADFDPGTFSADERRFLQQHSGMLPQVRPLTEGTSSCEGAAPGGAPDEFVLYPVTVEANGRQAATVQLPARLSWALTIHRAQGMSLDAAVVHLRGLFQPGHAYVALSRCRRASDVWVEGLPPHTSRRGAAAFRPDARVARFYAALGC